MLGMEQQWLPHETVPAAEPLSRAGERVTEPGRSEKASEGAFEVLLSNRIAPRLTFPVPAHCRLDDWADWAHWTNWPRMDAGG